LFGAEHQRPGRAGLDAGRLQPDRNPVRAQRALVGLAVLLGDARDVERASRHAIAAADAVLFVEVDDAVRVLHDRAGRGAGLEATRIGAVHAPVLADQPFEFALGLYLEEPHHRPGVLAQVSRVVVGPGVRADRVAQVIPFHARALARLAADALTDVDQFRNLERLTLVRRLRGGGGAALDVERLQCHGSGPLDVDEKRLE